MKRPLIIMGAGGHARVLLDILLLKRNQLIGITSADTRDLQQKIFGVAVIGSDDLIFGYAADEVGLVNGLGLMPGLMLRCQLYEKFKQHGYSFVQVIHPSAIMAADVRILEGAQIMAGAIIQAGAVIAENSLVNTRAVVEHDAYIGKHVHLASGVNVSGGVSIGEATFVGAGATIIQGINIGVHCVVAAGSTVVRDIPDGKTVMGTPARIITKEQF